MSDVKVIKTENGPVRIDASDYDEKRHELHVADEHHDADGVARGNAEPIVAPAKTGRAAKTVPPIVSPIDGTTTEPGAPGRNYDVFGVLQNKNKFFIVDGTTGKVVDDVDGIDPKGYAENKLAWDVLIAIKAAAAVKPATDNA